MKTLDLNDCQIEIIPSPEDEPIENALSFKNTGVDYSDYINEITDDCGCNVWLWCQVEVKVTYMGILTASEYLGQCAYKDEQDFINGGYYEQMIEDCLNDLKAQFKRLTK